VKRRLDDRAAAAYDSQKVPISSQLGRVFPDIHEVPPWLRINHPGSGSIAAQGKEFLNFNGGPLGNFT
jgi:hypothetical protein